MPFYEYFLVELQYFVVVLCHFGSHFKNAEIQKCGNSTNAVIKKIILCVYHQEKIGGKFHDRLSVVLCRLMTYLASWNYSILYSSRIKHRMGWGVARRSYPNHSEAV